MIDLKVIKHTRKDYKCSHCGKLIHKGSCCLYGSGTDYDDKFVSEHVHGIPEECFVDYLGTIEFMDESDVKRFRKEMQEVKKLARIVC